MDVNKKNPRRDLNPVVPYLEGRCFFRLSYSGVFFNPSLKVERPINTSLMFQANFFGLHKYKKLTDKNFSNQIFLLHL